MQVKGFFFLLGNKQQKDNKSLILENYKWTKVQDGFGYLKYTIRWYVEGWTLPVDFDIQP